MTTDQPQPTPGQHVLVEFQAVERLEGVLVFILVDRAFPDGYVPGAESVLTVVDPERVRWRPMPDDTAAEHDWNGEAIAEMGRHWMTPGNRCDCGFAQTTGWDDHIARAIAGRLRDLPAARPAAEPLAAGVPVGSLPGEPGPGAYLIGDLPAIRFPHDQTLAKWAIGNRQYDPDSVGYTWMSWDELTEEHPDKPMRRLLPRTAAEPTAAQAEAFLEAKWAGIQDELQRQRLTAAAEPLTLDAIRDVVREVLDARDDEEVTAAEERDGWRTKFEQQRDECMTVMQQLDEARRENDEMATMLGRRDDEAMAHRAAQVRLMQHLGMEGTPAEVADAAIRAINEAREAVAKALREHDEVWRDRNEARQDIARYDTGLAKLADALHAAGIHIGADVATVASKAIHDLSDDGAILRGELDGTRAERDEARRERDHLRRWLRDAAATLPDDAQEPAQTPGGDDENG